MSGRTQFWIGSLMLALAMGLLVGGMIVPRWTSAQAVEGAGEGETGNYAFMTGVEGTTPRAQTLYVLDDRNQFIYVLEYSSRSKDLEFRAHVDLRAAAVKFLKERAKTAKP